MALRSRPRLRGQSTSTPRSRERADALVEQADQLVGVEGDLVGHPQLQQPVEHRPGVGRGPQRDASRGCAPARRSRARRRRGSTAREVAEVQRVLLVVHLRHQAYGARDQLLLVGLDPDREPHQLRQVARRRRRWCLASRAWSRCSKVGPLGPARRRGGASAGAWRGIASATASSRPRTISSSSCWERASIAIRSSSSSSRPAIRQLGDVAPAASTAGRELAGGHEPHPQQRRPRRAARRSGAGPRGSGPCVSTGQRRPDRERDRAAVVGELDDALARRLGGRKVAGPVTGRSSRRDASPRHRQRPSIWPSTVVS